MTVTSRGWQFLCSQRFLFFFYPSSSTWYYSCTSHTDLWLSSTRPRGRELNQEASHKSTAGEKEETFWGEGWRDQLTSLWLIRKHQEQCEKFLVLVQMSCSAIRSKLEAKGAGESNGSHTECLSHMLPHVRVRQVGMRAALCKCLLAACGAAREPHMFVLWSSCTDGPGMHQLNPVQSVLSRPPFHVCMSAYSFPHACLSVSCPPLLSSSFRLLCCKGLQLG